MVEKKKIIPSTELILWKGRDNTHTDTYTKSNKKDQLIVVKETEKSI